MLVPAAFAARTLAQLSFLFPYVNLYEFFGLGGEHFARIDHFAGGAGPLRSGSSCFAHIPHENGANYQRG